MKFNYQARTKEGQIQSGVVEASSREAALALLQKYELFVTALEEAKAPFYLKRIKFFERITRKDVVVFSRQLAIMAKSNVPLVEALQTLANQTKNKSFKEEILKIAEEVEGGTPLSQTLASHPKIFSHFYTSMVKSGETSGTLSEVLSYLADHSEREYNFYSKLTGSMIYPVFVLVVFLVVVFLMVTFIIPNITQVLKETQPELPFVTKLVIGISDFFKKWWWAFFLSLFLLVLAATRFLKTQEGKKFLDRASLKMPFLGEFFKKIYLSRMAENLSTLISGGLPITQALEITGDIVGNDIYKTIILRARDGVRRGEALSSVLSGYPESFPPLFLQMTIIGERTGQLDSALLNIVDFYRADVERTLDGLLRLLEPIMIIGLGLIVAGLLMAVIIPLYSIGLGM